MVIITIFGVTYCWIFRFRSVTLVCLHFNVIKLIHNAYYHKMQIKFQICWLHFYSSLVICPFINITISEFFVSVLYLKLVSTKCYETYTLWLLPQSTNRVWILVASLFNRPSDMSLYNFIYDLQAGASYMYPLHIFPIYFIMNSILVPSVEEFVVGDIHWHSRWATQALESLYFNNINGFNITDGVDTLNSLEQVWIHHSRLI